jgi:hypothetical protein
MTRWIRGSGVLWVGLSWSLLLSSSLGTPRSCFDVCGGCVAGAVVGDEGSFFFTPAPCKKSRSALKTNSYCIGLFKKMTPREKAGHGVFPARKRRSSVVVVGCTARARPTLTTHCDFLSVLRGQSVLAFFFFWCFLRVCTAVRFQHRITTARNNHGRRRHETSRCVERWRRTAILQGQVFRHVYILLLSIEHRL